MRFQVSTFRCAKPSEAMQKALDDFKKKLADKTDGPPGSRGSDARRISTIVRQVGLVFWTFFCFIGLFFTL
jgi:hypothetical protein